MWKTSLTSLLFVLAGCDRGQPPAGLHAHTHGEIALLQPAAPAGEHLAADAGGEDAGKTVYVCPMHPEVVSDKPGDCPKCNMHLEPKPAGQK